MEEIIKEKSDDQMKPKFREQIKKCKDSEKLTLIRKNLKKKLTPDRYTHTMGVAHTCECLAMSLGMDISRAYLAGLLHDCAKCIPDEEKILKCEKYHIPITEIEYKSPYLLHSKLGAYLAREKYCIEDEEILSAITCHTTGKPAMTDLEMLLFVADYIEPGRSKAANLTIIRKEAFKNIKYSVYLILRDTLEYLKKKGNPIDAMTEKTFEYYRQLFE